MTADTPDGAVKRVRFVTFVGMFLNIFLVFAKGGIGLVSGSQALVADAVHSLSDLVTDFAVIFGVKYWSAPPDASHPYGHGKIETMISAFIGVALVIVAIGLACDAIATLMHGSDRRPGLIAFCMAIVSIVSKEILFRWTRTEARQLNSPAMEANAWHHRSDAISSIPVAAAIAVSYFFPQYGFIDPVGALLVSGFICYAAWEIIRPTLFELTEAGSVEQEQRIRDIALSVNGIRSVHAVRARGNGTAGFLADLHVMVDPELTVRAGHALAHEVKQRILHSGSHVTDVIIHVEPYGVETPGKPVAGRSPVAAPGGAASRGIGSKMTVETQRVGLQLIVVVTGAVDAVTAPELGRALEPPRLEGVRELVMDFAGVDFITSAGLRVVMAANQRLTAIAGRLVIRGARPNVREIFESTGFCDFLSFA